MSNPGSESGCRGDRTGTRFWAALEMWGRCFNPTLARHGLSGNPATASPLKRSRDPVMTPPAQPPGGGGGAMPAPPGPGDPTVVEAPPRRSSPTPDTPLRWDGASINTHQLKMCPQTSTPSINSAEVYEIPNKQTTIHHDVHKHYL